jgi:hypothetical protein
MSRTAAWGNSGSRKATGWAEVRAFIKPATFSVLRILWKFVLLRRILVGAIVAGGINPDKKWWTNLNARRLAFEGVAWSVPDRIFRQANMVRPQYIALLPHEFTATPYPETLRKRLITLFQLYAADVLKLSGYFSEAEFLLKRLLMRPGTRDLAALSLGDLLLLQASWTAEITAYEADALISTFLWTRPLSPGWSRVSFERALDALESVDPNSHNPDRSWLQACALMRSGSWGEALNHIRAYMASKPSDNTRQLAETCATYAQNREAGLAKAIANAGRWIAMLDITEVEIAHLKDGPRGEFIDARKVQDAITVSATPRIVYGGQVIAYKSEIVFDPVYDVTYQDAEILPNFGMIRAGPFLVTESSHIKREHWKTYTPSIIALREGNALLCRRPAAPFAEETAYYFGNNANYYHWLVEDMPRLLYLQDHCSAVEGYFLVDHMLTEWQQAILLRLGSDPSRWRCVDFHVSNKFERLVAPSLLSRNMCAHPTAIATLRGHLVPNAANAMPRAGNRIYLSRKGKQIRGGRLTNEQEIIRLLKAYGFATVNTGDLTIDQQIELFRDAEIIAGPGGAALTNMIFAPAGTKVLMLAPSGCNCETFVSVAGAIGQAIITCLGDSRPVPYPVWINATFDFSVRLSDVRLALDLLLTN